MGDVKERIGIISGSAGAILGAGGITSTSDTAQLVYIIITILCACLSLTMLIFKTYDTVKSHIAKAKQDGVITKEEVNQIVDDVSESAKKAAEIIDDTKEKINKGSSDSKN